MLPPEWKDGRFERFRKGCVIIITSVSFYHIFFVCHFCKVRCERSMNPPTHGGEGICLLLMSSRRMFLCDAAKGTILLSAFE